MPDNPLLAAALIYAANGWPVFRLSRDKVPLKGTHGHLDATTDIAQVRAWWDVPRPPNIGLACGRVVCLDLDGAGALESVWGRSLAELAAKHGGLPETLLQQTRRGVHLLFAAPDGVEIRTRNEPRKTKGADGVDIKGLGGYIVLTPSTSKGFLYHFIKPRPPAGMPQWLFDWCLTVGREQYQPKIPIANQLGNLPAYLQNTKLVQRDIGESARAALTIEWNPHEEARIRAALAAIPQNCGYDAFLKIGFALQGLGWERSDGTSIGFELWNEWCARGEHYNQAGLEKKWEEFSRNNRGEVSIGTILALAKEAGWRGEIMESEVMPPAKQPTETRPQPSISGTVGAAAAPVGTFSGFGPPTAPAAVFRDTTEAGNPKATALNTRIALQALRISCRRDVFHERNYVAGEAVDAWAGDLSDDVLLMLRQLIRDRHGFDPGEKAIRDAAVQLCLVNQFDPLLDYLDGLKWDGTPRLDNWLSAYLGADQTPLNAAIGRLVLSAAVRRAYQPGYKFDQILVLEGLQGAGKSTAIEILAGGPDYFSDATILGRADREQQEACVGVWLYEIADLQGMRKADVEHIKVFSSRTVDRARPAYGRFRVDKPRRCIFIATTNDDAYLKDQTGNRRFWPVLTRDIDLAGLRRDRDQLLAEACCAESQGTPLVLPPELWVSAAAEQEGRLEVDPWQDIIARYINDTKNPRDDVSLHEVLMENPYLPVRPEALTPAMRIRAGWCLKRLRWFRYNKRTATGYERRYKRLT